MPVVTLVTTLPMDGSSAVFAQSSRLSDTSPVAERSTSSTSGLFSKNLLIQPVIVS